MPRGIPDIPDLRLEVLSKFVTTFTAPPELVLMNLFPGDAQSPSSTIKWESQEGSRGMTPFVPPGSPSPQTAPQGVAQHQAMAANWREKMYFDEEFLNNIRKEGTESEYLDAKKRLAREMGGLTNRSNRRKEWMFSKMLFSGAMAYSVNAGVYISVDYSIPSTHDVDLGTDYQWQNGTKRDIWGDIIDGKKKVKEDCGGTVDYALFNSTVLQYLAQDPTIQTLLQKSAFGTGDLFKGDVNQIVGVNPKVIGALLDIQNFVVYDEQFEVRAWLTAVVTTDTTVIISVDDASDFEAEETLRFVDTSAGTYEDETISSVDEDANTVTVSTAPSSSYKVGEDYVAMRKYFVPNTEFVMFASKVDGQPIAEYKAAPYGLSRRYGISTDQHEEWDPEGVYIRVRDKGLPVLYQRDAMYILTVN